MYIRCDTEHATHQSNLDAYETYTRIYNKYRKELVRVSSELDLDSLLPSDEVKSLKAALNNLELGVRAENLFKFIVQVKLGARNYNTSIIVPWKFWN